MKKLFLLSSLLLATLFSNGQTSNRLLAIQAGVQSISAPNLVFTDPLDMNKFYVTATSALALPASQVTGFNSAVQSFSDTRYLQSYTETDPTVPTYAKSLSAFSVIRTSTDALYKPISYTPNSSEITTSLGYTPINPNGTNLQYIAGDGSKITFPSSITYTSGTGINISSGVISNTAPDQNVSLTGAGGLVASGTYPNFTLTQYVPTDNSVTRTINSSTYTISSTKAATVRYNIKISCTATIGSASTGKVLFQYSTNGGSSWIDAGEVENSNTVTLAVVLNSTTTQSGFIVWNVPANALCRLVPTSSGTTTITWIRGQETY